MQLDGKSLRKKLTLATCSLLGVASMAMADIQESTVLDNPPTDSQEETTTEEMNKESWFSFQGLKEKFKGWKVDGALLFYTEPDRVTAVEPVISATRAFSDEKYLKLKLVFDSLTGASANGATPAATAQTFTRPSGAGSYTTPAGETPLDDTFHDSRFAASAQWEQPLGTDWRGTAGLNFSNEYDFTSLGANTAVAYDLNNKNTTISLGASVELDQIDPEGGIPTPFASMAAPGAVQPRQGDSDDRQVIDGLLGLTQIINKRSLMQVNYSLSVANGYMTDPFKILSVVDGTAGSTLGDTVDYVYEKRPEDRTRQAIYTIGKYQFLNGDIGDLSYRYYWDSWGINSHTIDTHYRWFFGNGHFLEPHLRFYSQGPADFYRHSLVDTDSTPEFASADYRLGDMNSYTIGLKYGRKRENGHVYSVRFEYYLQTVNNHPDGGIGAQQSLDLSPSVDAFIVQLMYTMD